MNIPGAVAGRRLARHREHPKPSLHNIRGRNGLFLFFYASVFERFYLSIRWIGSSVPHHPLIVFTCPRFPGIFPHLCLSVRFCLVTIF
jgi:hypothetical protein